MNNFSLAVCIGVSCLKPFQKALAVVQIVEHFSAVSVCLLVLRITVGERHAISVFQSLAIRGTLIAVQ